MIHYNYFTPKNLEEALNLLENNCGKMKIVAGGTDLLIRIRAGKEMPEAIIDISKLGFNSITKNNNEMVLGAFTTLTRINEDKLLKKQPYCLIAETAGRIGAWQTRNLATIGGNICIGNSSADMAVALLALNAKVKIARKSGNSTYPLDKFFLAPRKTAVKCDEILTDLFLPNYTQEGYGSCFIKIGKRKGHSISVINIATFIQLDGNEKIQDIRIAMGTVAPIPIRLYKSEDYLKGKFITDETIDAAIEVMMSEISPRDSFRGSKEYRADVAKVIFKRAIIQSVEIAKRREQ